MNLNKKNVGFGVFVLGTNERVSSLTCNFARSINDVYMRQSKAVIPTCNLLARGYSILRFISFPAVQQHQIRSA